ncbi:MAG: PhzF family phenazine biosynthesis protein [Actinomycetota bacterium]|nr:PhzF family phenazine biosynthesis protein [Actinomycetota bacterium]
MSSESFGYRLADVFARRPYEGNGVAVFVDPPRLSAASLQAITVEVRQFESAFLWSTSDSMVYETRIFVVDQELEFAGHPVLGAAAVLHERRLKAVQAIPGRSAQHSPELAWTLRLGEREVSVTSQPDGIGDFDVSMDQGQPQFGDPMPQPYRDRVARALSLTPQDLDDHLPMQWVSTGLRYLMVPVRGQALARARIAVANFAALLAEAGAQLAYVLDPHAKEGRNWVNDGGVEDIATGSASGPAAAYLVRHRRVEPVGPVELAQGRFVGRPSVMRVDVTGSPEDIRRVTLNGHVCLTGTGSLDRRPDL